MTTYRLPDGTEIASLDINASTDAAKAWITHPTLGSILIGRDKLTEVKPPLPPEPPTGAVVVDRMGVPWKREGNGWFCDVAGNGVAHSWPELRDYWPLTRLVPDPADDAPELPLHIYDDNGDLMVTVEPSDAYRDRLFVEIDSGHLHRDTVRKLASALWAWAAREVQP